MHVLLSEEVGRRALLLGNEAVVRGALEAGVGLVTGYPGTPASEIGDAFANLHAERGIRFEYSVNEKVALELAYGASLAGARTLVSMKHLGLMYAGDPLSTMPYIGTVGGMLIVSAADPGCLTSPNEQDQRHLARMLGLPTLDPATPDEARRMSAWAFELSEACQLPVLLRITTRVCHTRAPVELGALGVTRLRGSMVRDPGRFLPVPAIARLLRIELDRRLKKACTLMTESPFNRMRAGSGEGSGVRRGVIAAGAPRNAVDAALERLGVSPPVLGIGTLHPLPHELIARFLRELDEVLIVEELTPYLEDSVLAIAHELGVTTRIHGKRDQQMSGPFELLPGDVEGRIAVFLGEKRGSPALSNPSEINLPIRTPTLCPGCPHRNVFYAANAVFDENVPCANDIGCYTLGTNEPHRMGDVLLAMGSSIPLASGLSRTIGRRAVAFIGDSTFIHSGIPALINAVEQKDDLVVVILDNHVTAMTGLQPNAASVGGSLAGRIPEIVRAVGATDVVVVESSDVRAIVRALERARQARGVSVVIASGPCMQLVQKERGRREMPRPQVDPEACHTCGMAESGLHCGLPPSLAVQRRMAIRHSSPDVTVSVPRTSPCSAECPVGICVPAYIGAMAAGEMERAFQAVELRAALPSACSHLCHRPCEDQCVRGTDGSPVAINALKRHLTERVSPPPKPRLDEAAFQALPQVAVVGAGPAGLAAVRELLDRGYAPTLFDARERPGGMLEYAIPDYRMPRSALRRDVERILARGVRFEPGRRLGANLSLDELRQRGFAAVVLALGASRGSPRDVPGAGLAGVEDALAFLERPPACDGEHVLVVGGGDVAIDVARTALRRGAAQVTLVAPEAETDLSAAPDAVDLAMSEGVALKTGTVARELSTGGGGRVAWAELARVRGFRRKPGRGVEWDALEPAGAIPIQRAVFATGQRADLEGIALPPGLLAEHGWLAADANGRTRERWLFAAGDVVTGPTNVTMAMASGARAAWAVDETLSEGRRAVSPPAAPPPRPPPPHRRRPTILHANLAPLTGPQARTEAERCLLCGLCKNCHGCIELLGCPAIVRSGDAADRPRIEAELCTSCMACADVCPNRAIALEEPPRT